MNVKTTVVLVVIVVLLLALVLIFGESAPETERKGPLFPEFLAEDVTEVSWTKGAEPIQARRAEGGGWEVEVAGRWVAADDTYLEDVLNEIRKCRVESEIPAAEVDAVKRQDYGLDPPIVTVTFEIRGQERKLRLGSPGAGRDTLYAGVDDSDDVLVVTDDVMDTVEDLALGDLRRTRVFQRRIPEVHRLEILKDGQPWFDAERSAADETIWVADVPFSDFVDPIRMESNLLPPILQIEVGEFVKDGVGADDLAAYGLAEPRWRITFEKKRGTEETQTLLIGDDVPEKESEVYFMEAGGTSVYAGNAGLLLTELARDPAERRDRNLLRVDVWRLGKIEAAYGDLEYSMVEVHDDWRLEKPETVELDKDAVEDWIDELRGLKIARFLDGPPADLASYGLTAESPRGRLVFWPKPKGGPHAHEEEEAESEEDGMEPVSDLLLGDPIPAGGVYARRADRDDVVFELSTAILDRIRPGWLRFKEDKTVFALSYAGAGAKEMTRVREGGAEERAEWVGGTLAGATEKAWGAVLGRIMKLDAVRWVAPAEGREEEFGLGDDAYLRFTITVTVDGVDKTNGLIVGKPTTGGRYARAIRGGAPGPAVFVISPTDLALFEASWQPAPEKDGDGEGKDE